MSFQDNIPSQPPRPPNAFLCFRSRFIREQKASHARGAKGSMMQDISRQAAHRWNGMSEEERRPYFDMALRMREEHRVTYPDYKFTPSKRGSGKSAGHRAQASRRRAQATGGPKEPEPGQSSFMAYFYHDDSHPMPTLSSPYTPPPVEDRLYRSEDSLYSRATSMSNSAGRNEVFEFNFIFVDTRANRFASELEVFVRAFRPSRILG
jgi:hypothetical protein